ncbi:hypothetical protein CPB84DRAFT_1813749 [Gymnopilus junonius]|uniref:Cdc23 domain-containing protein n=1 Tax=Gymnopilus junonius TaxID=109634 RepID=A0A9P5TRC2_GYMJU|nr:hypothetical protein CPB84DRAFT_1813749 [Gymnopilus junonius]
MTSAVDAQTISEIRTTSKECLDRGLLVAAKWLSELLLSVSPAKRKGAHVAPSSSNFSTSTPARPQSLPVGTLFPSEASRSPILSQVQTSDTVNIRKDLYASSVEPRQGEILFLDRTLEKEEEDLLLAARSCFEAREFHRATYLIKECKNNRHQPPTPINQFLGELYDLVKDSTDPWLLFLKALFLSRLSRREEAIESALLSIAGCKWNWSAWTLLGSCVGDGEELSSLLHLIPLPSDHPLVQFFQIKTLNELQNPSENELQLYFSQAVTQFEQILSIDPNHIDDIDIYSNILYVTDSRLKLTKLAHEFLALDKDRPEVCCLIGNHYSLRAEHEKAVKYFRRATQLDRTYVSAWTLMGHEYVEMKNSHAAIEAYRRAVDVNRKDYRAWYGLGQAYELLSMHHYSLHYYQRATALRAQGMCYEEIGRLHCRTELREAVECYKRALIPADPHEITINLKLAKIHRSLDEHSESVAYHRRVVEVCQADLRPIQDYAKSCLEIAEYEMRIPGGDLILARDYLELVASSNAEEVGRAADLLKTAKASTDN